MKARAALAKAPIRVMSPSRSGIPNASPASRREGGERERERERESCVCVEEMDT